jgi:hypothetical protein
MKKDLPEKKGRLAGMKSALDQPRKRPTFGLNQGGSSKSGNPAKVAAKNADIQRRNSTRVNNAGNTAGSDPTFGDGFQET